MDRALLLGFACLLALAGVAPADIYRCEESDGGVRFDDDPHHCPGAERLEGGPREPESGALALPADAERGREVVQPRERPARQLRLEDILLSAAGLAGRWEVVDEAPSDPAEDPDLVRWGVRAQRARHYTRDGDDGVQVCSIEIWSFEDARRARLAHENFSYPNWHFERQENLLIMVRAVTLSHEGPQRRELFADCRRLGALTSARAAARLRR